MQNLFVDNQTGKTKLKWDKIILLTIAIGILIWVATRSWSPVRFSINSENKSNSLTSALGYSTIYLSNNQVYFGRIELENDLDLVLTNVYYLQQSTIPADGKVTLIKLGNEIHGPEDRIYFNRKQITQIYQMRDDSEIIKAILKYESEGGKQ